MLQLKVEKNRNQTNSKELDVSVKTQFLNALTFHEKIFMYCIHLELRQTGALETSFEKVLIVNLCNKQVAERHLEICNQSKLVNVSVLHSICYQLSQLKLIVCSSVRDDLDQKIMLNVTTDDISIAMTRDEKCYAIARVFGGIEAT